MEYFTVDRKKALSQGMIIKTDTDYKERNFWPIKDAFTADDLAILVNELHPRGLTEHGKKYLLDECLVVPTPNGPAPVVPHTPMVELVFELVRRLEYPDHVSRFEAVFGWQTVEEAASFKASFGSDDSALCVVNCSEAFRHDMSLLYLGGSTIGSIFYARKYWRGDSGNSPRWEILMRPPVQVVRVL